MSSIYTGAVFNNGVILRILEIAGQSVERDGGVSLDEELGRFTRLLKSSRVTEWTMPLATVSALLELSSDTIERDPSYPVPPGFTEALEKAAGGMASGAYLRTLGSFIRDHDQRRIPSYTELPIAAWEAKVKFSKLWGFGAYWLDIAEYGSFTESVLAAIDSEHPNACDEVLPPLATQAQEALILFPAPDMLTANLRQHIGWGSHDALREVLDLINKHMSEQH